MIFLVSRRVEPLWGNGHVSVALIQGNDKEDAICKAIEAEKMKQGMHSKDSLRGEYKAVGINEGFMKIEVLEGVGD